MYLQTVIQNVLFVFLTQDVDVSIAKCISMNIAGITLDNLQITATIGTVLTHIRQNQLRPTTCQTHPLWQAVCCNVYSTDTVNMMQLFVDDDTNNEQEALLLQRNRATRYVS